MKTAEKNPVAGQCPALLPPSSPARVPSSKILSTHLEKPAVVYVRQSSPRQVLENRESTARQ
ncbi:MAG: hypothetical protein ABSH35_05655 [Isosphaeraceae bacterium]|jgi:hypothetical protein